MHQPKAAEIKGCIFDMDGVIVDTAHYHYLSWKEITDDWGFDFTPKANEILKGVSRTESLRLILELAGLEKSEEEKTALCVEKNDWYRQSISNMTADDALPGILPFIEELKAAGLKVALGSASKNARHLLTLMGLSHHFDGMVDGNDLTRSKPDPQVFLLAAEAMDLLPSECIVIEDAAKGIAAAQAAGMRTVGIGEVEYLGAADLVLSSTSLLSLPFLKNRLSADQLPAG